MSIGLKRVYETPSRSDGCRILVERLWPRGLSKQKARIDVWAKQAAPSGELRRWFGHDPEKWVEFKRRYFEELDSREEGVAPIIGSLRTGPVTFVFAAREPWFNNAVALKEYLELRVQPGGSLRPGAAEKEGQTQELSPDDSKTRKVSKR